LSKECANPQTQTLAGSNALAAESALAPTGSPFSIFRQEKHIFFEQNKPGCVISHTLISFPLHWMGMPARIL
jgi:hypothetical protein